MRVLILGSGRSGTKLVYRLVSTLIQADPQSGWRLIYEPLLWDERTWDTVDFAQVPGLYWSDPNAYRTEGLALHLALPLIVQERTDWSGVDVSYLRRIIEPKKQITKFIRANGRYHFLRLIQTWDRVIFVIRNPISVINSIKGKHWSLLGQPYHQSDWSRLVQEVRALNEAWVEPFLPFLTTSEPTSIIQETVFWACENLFFIHHFPDSDSFFLFDFDSYLSAPGVVLRDLAGFLQKAQDIKGGCIHKLEQPHSVRATPRFLMQSEIKLIHTLGIPAYQEVRELASKKSNVIFPHISRPARLVSRFYYFFNGFKRTIAAFRGVSR